VATKILKVKVKETNADKLPEPLQAPGKQREYEVLRQTEKETLYPNGRFLLKTPPGGGGFPLDAKEESWWVPRECCDILEQEGEPVKVEEKKVEEVKTEGKVVAAMGFKAMVVSDATKAAYIVAGEQLTLAVRGAMLKITENQLREKYGSGKKADSAVKAGLEAFQMFLDGPLGKAAIQASIGYGLVYAPGIKDDPRVQILSEQMRVQGIATAGNAVVGAAMEYVMPAVTAALSTLPKLEGLDATLPEQKPELEQIKVGAGSEKSAAA